VGLTVFWGRKKKKGGTGKEVNGSHFLRIFPSDIEKKRKKDGGRVFVIRVIKKSSWQKTKRRVRQAEALENDRNNISGQVKKGKYRRKGGGVHSRKELKGKPKRERPTPVSLIGLKSQRWAQQKKLQAGEIQKPAPHKSLNEKKKKTREGGPGNHQRDLTTSRIQVLGRGEK